VLAALPAGRVSQPQAGTPAACGVPCIRDKTLPRNNVIRCSLDRLPGNRLTHLPALPPRHTCSWGTDFRNVSANTRPLHPQQTLPQNYGVCCSLDRLPGTGSHIRPPSCATPAHPARLHIMCRRVRYGTAHAAAGVLTSGMCHQTRKNRAVMLSIHLSEEPCATRTTLT
jgi:hypothetical protein